MATRKHIDWEAVEGSFRSGAPSVRALAKKHGISEGAIRKRATKEGWRRDLTQKVQAATKEKLVRAKVRTEGTQRTDAEIIEIESDDRVNVVLGHREDLARWRRLANKLGDVLEDMDVHEENHNEYARSLNAGVEAQLKLIKGEREAYNLGSSDDDKTVQSLSDLMDDLATEA